MFGGGGEVGVAMAMDDPRNSKKPKKRNGIINGIMMARNAE